MEGHISDNHIRIERQTHHIAYDDGRTARPGTQAFAAVLIDLDRRELPAEPLERAREVAVAGADFEYRSVGGVDETHNRGDRRSVGEKILAELVSATGRRSGHGG